MVTVVILVQVNLVIVDIVAIVQVGILVIVD